MKKKSKIRIPQDVKPWRRVTPKNEKGKHLSFFFPTKMRAWGNTGSRGDRYYKTLCFWTKKINNDSHLQKNCISKSLSGENVHRARTGKMTKLMSVSVEAPGGVPHKIVKLADYKTQLHQFSSLTKLRNYCLIAGKSRSYLRDFRLYRHTLKELSRCSNRLVGLYRDAK